MYITLSCLIHLYVDLHVHYVQYSCTVLCVPCVCCAFLQEETREILESRRQELDCSSDSSASSSQDSGGSFRPLALFKRIRRDKRREKVNVTARALVIDGQTLSFVLNGDLKSLFIDVARRCVSVICCRTTPIQKVSSSCAHIHMYMCMHSCMLRYIIDN